MSPARSTRWRPRCQARSLALAAAPPRLWRLAGGGLAVIADRLVVLVTGASAGIGSAVADAFAGAGWRVFGTSRRARPDGVGVEMLQLDVRSDQCATACVRQLLDRAGRIDVLVNDAGVMHTGIAGERPHWRKPAICLTPTCFGWSG